VNADPDDRPSNPVHRPVRSGYGVESDPGTVDVLLSDEADVMDGSSA